MRYHVDLPGFEDGRVRLDYRSFRPAVLLLDGAPAPAGSSPDRYVLTRDDGLKVEVSLKVVGVDPVPQVLFQGELFRTAPPLGAGLTALAMLPLLLLLNGFFGLLLGAGGFYLNLVSLRSDWPAPARFLTPLVTLLIGIAAMSLFE